MSKRKLQEFDVYEYGSRGVLCPGDQFRVSGGPYYENEDGSKTLMAERGTFKFVRYCARGASRWIEATRVGGGMVVLWVGKAGPSKDLPSFKRRPYKVRKVTERKCQSGKGTRRPGKRAVAATKPETSMADNVCASSAKGEGIADKVCASSAKVTKGKRGRVKPAKAKPEPKAEPTVGAKVKPTASERAKGRPKAKSGSTSARAGSGEKRGKNGGEGLAGRGKGSPSTSGSTSI